MLLRNKKTGEMGIVSHFDNQSIVIYPVDENWNAKGDKKYVYASLAELNEEWEDYEEPKEAWYIDFQGGLHCASAEDNNWSLEKIIGNYFDTREEAEKAVEKLKAWKQLKDNCNFRFNGLERDERGRLTGVKVEFDKAQVTFDTAKRCYEILTLLFGGEE